MLAPPDCMIDIETLGARPDAAICSIAAVRFDALGRSDHMETLEILIDLDDCLVNHKRTFDTGTLEWWGKQKPEVQFKAMEQGPRVTLAEGLDQLSKFASGSSRMWAQGTNFDPVILEGSYMATKQTAPWGFWQWRDSRTLFAFVKDLPAKGEMAHDALYDAIHQAKNVQFALQKLGVDSVK